MSWRAYIRDFLSAVPARTQRRLASAVGCCAAQMSNILNQSQPEDPNAPVTRYAKGLALALDLDPEEERYFRALVQYRQSKKGTLEHDEAWLSIRSTQRFQEALRLHRLGFDYIRNPVAVAIREMARSPHFRNDPRWIRDRLIPKPTLSTVQEALGLLTRLGLLTHGAFGDAEPVQVGVVIDDANDDLATELQAEQDEALKESHRRNIHLALKALDQMSGQERYVNGATALVPIEAREELFRLFKDWQMRWATRAERQDTEDLARTRVYRLNLQFIPLSQVVEPAGDGGEE
ncbi:MAG: TIGR02147 family protein [Alphaproteobacteria bacterium]|nr:TIGR02147 family protein [Alphaproteobacteria bacterium]